MASPSSDDLDALLARIASRTEALRVRLKADTPYDEERALLEDLTRVAAILRADATAIGESLARVLDAGAPGADEAREQP